LNHAEAKEADMLHPDVSRTLLWSSLAALMICAAPGAATAADNDAAVIIKSATVRLTDLNLSRPADAAALYQRIRRAARKVCGDELAGGSPPASPLDWDCVREAVASAVTRVNQPLLTAVHQRNGGTAPSGAGA
jgi:UrcA family protein